MGLMVHLQKKQMPKIQKCILERREKPKMVRLSLQSFTSAFVILAIGIGCGGIVCGRTYHQKVPNVQQTFTLSSRVAHF